jgi:putative Mg2+ transporter-C (MgtC) family protein
VPPTGPSERSNGGMSEQLSFFRRRTPHRYDDSTRYRKGFCTIRHFCTSAYFFIANARVAQLNLIWAICYVLVVVYSILINVGPIALTWIIPKEEWCGLDGTSPSSVAGGRRRLSGDFKEASSDHESYANPDYITDPCRYLRVPELLFFTLEECDMSRRLLCSVILGGIIGYERRSADRPAGIRTMGLVSLGACSFTISSIMAFKSSTMGWDASRVTAALPSGVGFLGGALIWKGSILVNEEEVHQVHGLTTAASLWLSAAVGVGTGGALYLVTTYVVIMVIAILRYAPKSFSVGNLEEELEHEEEREAHDDDEQQGQPDPTRPVFPSPIADGIDGSAEAPDRVADQVQSEYPDRDLSLRWRKALQKSRSVRHIVPTFAE